MVYYSVHPYLRARPIHQCTVAPSIHCGEYANLAACRGPSSSPPALRRRSPSPSTAGFRINKDCLYRRPNWLDTGSEYPMNDCWPSRYLRCQGDGRYAIRISTQKYSKVVVPLGITASRIYGTFPWCLEVYSSCLAIIPSKRVVFRSGNALREGRVNIYC